MDNRGIVEIGSRRELFVDDVLVGALSGVTRRMHYPQTAGVALAMDAPWEGPFSFYTTVLQDQGRYLMYYRGWAAVGATPGQQTPACTCVATSGDGVHWSRPNLGIVDLDGSRSNNIILHEQTALDVCHNFCPFVDQRPGVSSDERFKALGGTWSGTGGLHYYSSADGLHWRRASDQPVITHPTFAFDSQNVAFWSVAEERYVCYYRTFTPAEPREARVRWVTRRTSDDFVHWDAPVEMGCEGGSIEHLYTQQTTPYYRAPHIYVALASRFLPGRQSITAEQAQKIGVDERYWHDLSDGVLLTTRAGSSSYQRTFMESFVRPGPGPEHWVSRTNYPACGLLPTGEHEMSLYVNRRYAQPESYVERLTLRPDGFASVHADYGGGELVTRPLRFEGARLRLNYATSAAGGLRVGVETPAGEPIAGYALEDADEMIGDHLDGLVRWGGREDMSALEGRPIRLRIAMHDADLYALRWTS